MTKSYETVHKNPLMSLINAIDITIKVQQTVLIKMFLQTILNMSVRTINGYELFSADITLK